MTKLNVINARSGTGRSVLLVPHLWPPMVQAVLHATPLLVPPVVKDTSQTLTARVTLLKVALKWTVPSPRSVSIVDVDTMTPQETIVNPAEKESLLAALNVFQVSEVFLQFNVLYVTMMALGLELDCT